MNQTQAAELLLMLKVAYPQADKDLDERTVEARNRLYLVELQDLTSSVAQAAVQEHIRTSAWYPTIADIRKQYDAQNGRAPAWKPPALPPAGEGYATRAERAKQAREAVEKIMSCEHGELARAGKLTREHPCFRQCVHARDYFARATR